MRVDPKGDSLAALAFLYWVGVYTCSLIVSPGGGSLDFRR